LQVIDARKNKIASLEMLSILPSLQEVYLQDNAISHISPNTFLAKSNLTTVHLERNQLLTLEMTSLMISITQGQSKCCCRCLVCHVLNLCLYYDI
jgi:Leucine-rich repeat (LRR) protein